MYLFEINTSNNNDLQKLEQALEDVQYEDVLKAIKKNWDGTSDILQLFLSGLAGGGIATILNFIRGMYKQGLVKIKCNGYEVTCHKNNLDDVSKFVKHLESSCARKKSKNT
jgi:hypothetical protein